MHKSTYTHAQARILLASQGHHLTSFQAAKRRYAGVQAPPKRSIGRTDISRELITRCVAACGLFEYLL